MAITRKEAHMTPSDSHVLDFLEQCIDVLLKSEEERTNGYFTITQQTLEELLQYKGERPSIRKEDLKLLRLRYNSADSNWVGNIDILGKESDRDLRMVFR